jgi:hypothetical protein
LSDGSDASRARQYQSEANVAALSKKEMTMQTIGGGAVDGDQENRLMAAAGQDAEDIAQEAADDAGVTVTGDYAGRAAATNARG